MKCNGMQSCNIQCNITISLLLTNNKLLLSRMHGRVALAPQLTILAGHGAEQTKHMRDVSGIKANSIMYTTLTNASKYFV